MFPSTGFKAGYLFSLNFLNILFTNFLFFISFCSRPVLDLPPVLMQLRLVRSERLLHRRPLVVLLLLCQLLIRLGVVGLL